ncbi:MAG: hypothetical protein WBE46_00045 [Dehalococcoidia bacterium]
MICRNRDTKVIVGYPLFLSLRGAQRRSNLQHKIVKEGIPSRLEEIATLRSQ